MREAAIIGGVSRRWHAPSSLCNRAYHDHGGDQIEAMLVEEAPPVRHHSGGLTVRRNVCGVDGVGWVTNICVPASVPAV
jgi:hypothetical protein